MLIHFRFPTFAVGFQEQQQTISLKVFLSLLEHLLSKSGGDCTFIHQFIECQSEYRVFFTLILMQSGAEIEKWEEKLRSQCVCYRRSAQRAIFRQQQYFLHCFGFSLLRKLFLWHLPSKRFHIAHKKKEVSAFTKKNYCWAGNKMECQAPKLYVWTLKR